MKKHDLNIPKGYDQKNQAKIGYVAAQLDDQLKQLKKNVGGLTIKQLEWQQKPGMNTIGMLLGHIALAEYWWINLATKGIKWNPDGQKMMTKVCGFGDDGLPLPEDGKHYHELRGYSLDKYLKVLARVRRATHKELRTWHDRDLDTLYEIPKHARISYGWTLYHVLEHFSGHFGQILLLKHLMHDAGVLKAKQ